MEPICAICLPAVYRWKDCEAGDTQSGHSEMYELVKVGVKLHHRGTCSDDGILRIAQCQPALIYSVRYTKGS